VQSPENNHRTRRARATRLGCRVVAALTWLSAQLVLSLIVERSLRAQDAVADATANLWSRSELTGDWWGSRTALRDSGITFAGKTTQFAFGVDGGIHSPPIEPLGRGDRFAYTGRNEYDALLDLEQIADLHGASFLVRLEHWYGEYANVSLNTGTFAAAIAAAELPPAPDDRGTLFVTNFLWTQALSEHVSVYAGRKSGLQPAGPGTFGGGDGTDQFINMALFDNPSLLLGVPYTSFNLGFDSTWDWGEVSAFVCDPTDRTLQTFPIDELFSQGVVTSGQVTWRTELCSRPGRQHAGVVWKHVQLTDLEFAEPPPGVYPEPTVPGFPTLGDSFTVYCGFDQYIVREPNSDRGWGVFGRASVSDSNPTPVWYFLSAGVGGDSPLGDDRGDTFGVGGYFVGSSHEFGAAPIATYGPRNGIGIEVFYNWQATPWLNITPDLQYLHPEASAIADDSFIGGLRIVARF
jgi:porin